MADQNNKLIIILAAVFLAVIVVAAALFFLVPGTPKNTTVPVGSNAPLSNGDGGLDFTVLQRQQYQLLNRQLLQEGALPVAPPPQVGKPNPFL